MTFRLANFEVLLTPIFVFWLTLSAMLPVVAYAAPGPNGVEASPAKFPLSLRIIPLQPLYPGGSDVIVRLVITNTSDISLNSPGIDGDERYLDCVLNYFHVNVIDGSGSPVHITQLEEDQRKPITAVLGLIYRKGTSIPPGGSQSADVDLSSMFDLTVPSQYTAVIPRKYYSPNLSLMGGNADTPNSYRGGVVIAKFDVTEPTSDYYHSLPIIQQLSTQTAPKVKYLYTTEVQDCETPGGFMPTYAGLVSMYQIDDSGSPLQTFTHDIPCGTHPDSMAFSLDGADAYVATLDGTIWQFSVEGDGELLPLTPASVDIGSSAADMIVSRDDRQVYISVPSEDCICAIRRNSDGTLLSTSANKTTLRSYPGELAEPVTGRFLYSDDSGEITKLAINNDGSLSANSAQSIHFGGNVILAAVSHNGKYLYAVNRFDDKISQFLIGPDGALGQLASVVECPAMRPTCLAMSQDDTELFITSFSPSDLMEFDVQPDGSLEKRPISCPLNIFWASQCLIDPDQKSVCVTSQIDPSFLTVTIPINPNYPVRSSTLQMPSGYTPNGWVLQSMPVRFAWHQVTNGPALALYLQKHEFSPEEPIVVCLLNKGSVPDKIAVTATMSVLDAQGKQVPRTDYGRERFGLTGPIDPGILAQCGNHISTGEYFVLNRVFDMTVPGIYRVDVTVGKRFEQQEQICVTAADDGQPTGFTAMY